MLNKLKILLVVLFLLVFVLITYQCNKYRNQVENFIIEKQTTETQTRIEKSNKQFDSNKEKQKELNRNNEIIKSARKDLQKQREMGNKSYEQYQKIYKKMDINSLSNSFSKSGYSNTILLSPKGHILQLQYSSKIKN